MKKIALVVGGFVALVSFMASLCHSEGRVYSNYLINEKALSYSKNIDLKLDTIDDLSMQAIYSSATLSTASFNDGVASTGSITVASTSTLTGARVSVAGYPFTNGSEWTAVATASGCAKAISDALMADPRVNALIVSTWTSGGVVIATAVASGAAGNAYTLYSSTPGALVKSGAVFTGGADSKVNMTTDQITVANHGFSTGTPLLLTTTAGTAPTGLTTGTTYYAIVKDLSTLQLAATSTGAVAGLAINITAQTANGGGTFTLTPTPFAGTYSLAWWGSNDDTNWFSLSNATGVTYSTPGTTEWDGPIYFRWLRCAITAGTGGGLNIQIIGNGKRKS